MSNNRVAVVGAAGRMGRRLVVLVNQDRHLHLGAAVESPESDFVGMDAGELAGIGCVNVPIQGSLDGDFDVIIDFSHADALIPVTKEALKRQIPLVSGTTGLEPEHHAVLEEAASEIPLVWSPSFSVGVNILFKIVEEVAQALGEDYDAEIVEAHHRFKKDAPSGTAKRLAQAIAKGREVRFDRVVSYGRSGMTGERKREEIGIHAVRAGDIVGEHNVIFSSLGERLELIHRAHKRDAFVAGAVRAAKFLLEGLPPGKYDMMQVLGL